MHSALTSRLMELLAGEAAGELSAEERAELQIARASSLAGTDLMRVAALAQVAFLETERTSLKRLPPALEARLEVQASSWSAAARPQDPNGA
jgi:hypothetical protein